MCPDCKGTGIKPDRSVAEVHLREKLGTFCICPSGAAKWLKVLESLSSAEASGMPKGERKPLSARIYEQGA